MVKIKEFEENHNVLVYAVTHEYTEFGERYDLLYVPDYKEEWDEIPTVLCGVYTVNTFVPTVRRYVCRTVGVK